jgi:hypothetical protein
LICQIKFYIGSDTLSQRTFTVDNKAYDLSLLDKKKDFHVTKSELLL